MGLLPAARLLAFQSTSAALRLRSPTLVNKSFVEVRAFSTSKFDMEKLKVAVIGQSQFAAEVYKKVGIV